MGTLGRDRSSIGSPSPGTRTWAAGQKDITVIVVIFVLVDAGRAIQVWRRSGGEIRADAPGGNVGRLGS